ncbi:MAG: hypothetical protein M3Q07_02405, partial [Pseudobdellovibrionaceae bacterium]|nr:hypothetical protein [Pseudobdellovibrionaceae bacterium]
IQKGWISDFKAAHAPSILRLGRDLLWTGSFEDQAVGLKPRTGALWLFPGVDKAIAPQHAYAGGLGAGIWRERSDTRDIVLTTQRRILIKPKTQVTLVGMARTNGRLHVQLSWHPDSKGPSMTQTVVTHAVPPTGEWVSFRVDAVAPEFPDYVIPIETTLDDERAKPAVGLYLRLLPSETGQKVYADFDDLRLIEWAPEGSAFSPMYDHAWIIGKGHVTMREDFLPGAG